MRSVILRLAIRKSHNPTAQTRYERDLRARIGRRVRMLFATRSLRSHCINRQGKYWLSGKEPPISGRVHCTWVNRRLARAGANLMGIARVPALKFSSLTVAFSLLSPPPSIPPTLVSDIATPTTTSCRAFSTRCRRLKHLRPSATTVLSRSVVNSATVAR